MPIIIFILVISLILIIPLALAMWLRRYVTTPWLFFCVGMVTFVVSQLYHLPLNNWLSDIGLIGPVSADDPKLWQTAIVLGLSAGISEGLARLIGYWLLFRKQLATKWQDGVMVGLGHGGIEAMLVGAVLTATSLSALWGLRGVDLSELGLSATELLAVTQQLELIEVAPWLTAASLIERAIAITLHVVVSMLIWQGLQKRQLPLLLLAIGYHALVDASAVYLAQNTTNIWIIEGSLALLMLPGAIWLWRRWLHQARSNEVEKQPLSEGLRLLGIATRHELFYQWRTKRFLVICAVFIIFGLGSPLVAKFTPQLLQNLEGAEQFADLIPEPSAIDAVTQYISNITQFGFIIVIVMGMGAIANEKEKGTAAIILSKPLPRWVFIISKFIALAAVLLIAMLLATASAYYYTLLLFEPLSPGGFLLGNLFLWLWLLVFSAITMLASTFARSNSAAAGIALLGAIIIFVVGGIPQIAPVSLNTLVAWASELALDTTTPPNGGALVMALTLLISCLIWAVALFERQEI